MPIRNKKSLALIVGFCLSGGVANACSFVFWDGFEGDGYSESSLCPSVKQPKLNDTGVTLCTNFQWYSPYGINPDPVTGIGSASRNPSISENCAYTRNAVGDLVPPGQDGHFATGPGGSYGMSLSHVSGHEGKCVLDNHTGLMWEVKQGGDGVTKNDGLHDADDTFSWYSDTNNHGRAGSRRVGNTCYGYGADLATTCNTQAYIARVNAEGWCGYSDWRLPSREELLSIADYSSSSPTIDTTYFVNTPTRGGGYWTSSPSAMDSIKAWYISSISGGADTISKSGSLYVRLVRDNQ